MSIAHRVGGDGDPGRPQVPGASAPTAQGASVPGATAQGTSSSAAEAEARLAAVPTRRPRPAGSSLKALDGPRVHLEPFDTMVGPVTHLDRERVRLRALEWRHFEAEQLGATIGAEISGVDLNDVDDELADELWRALLEYKVIFFREQELTPAGHVTFARQFGDLELHPFIPANPEHPELVRFEKGEDTAGFENGWHSDVTWRERPSMGTVLRAVQVPKTGGDTLFADMYAAYDGLDEALKARIDSMTAVHDYARVFSSIVDDDKRESMRRQFPPVVHPVVRRHPDTGRKLVYVNRFFVQHIVGVDEAESAELIDFLSSQAELVEYQCRFRWREGSVAFWDNRAVQHYAASDYWPEVRVMERASIVGDRPN